MELDSIATTSLGSIWILSTIVALLPGNRILLKPDSAQQDERTPTSSDPTLASDLQHSWPNRTAKLQEKFKGEIILEEQFKHEISRARILLSFFSLILFISRTLRLGYVYFHQDDRILMNFELVDGLIWFNFLGLSWTLKKSLSFYKCLHLFTLSSWSFIFQILLLITPSDNISISSLSLKQLLYRDDPISIFSIAINAILLLLTLANLYISSSIPLGPRRAYSTNPGTIPSKEVSNLSLRDGTSILSRIFFSYCLPIISKVKKNGRLTPQDVPFLDTSMRAEVLGKEFEEILEKEKSKLEEKQRKKKVKKVDAQSSPWPLFWTLIRSNSVGFGFMTFTAPIVAASFYAPALCLNKIVEFLEENEKSTDPEHHTPMFRLQHAGIYCVLLGLVTLVGGSLQNTFFAYGGEMDARMKIQLRASIFSKTLRKKDISAGSDASATAQNEDSDSEDGEDGEEEDSFKSKAQVIQLSSVDTGQVSEFAESYFALVLFPFELLIGGSFIYSILGNAALVGILASILLAPVTSWIASRQGGVQKKLQKARDIRVSVLNEAFAAIRMIKFAAWENKIQDKVLTLRASEIYYQKLTFIIDVILEALFVLTPNVSILITFAWFVFFQEETLKPSVAFSGISVLLELRYLLSHVPELISSIVISWVSTRRIATYLGSEEVELSENTSDGVVAIRSATIGWPIERTSEGAGSSGTSTPAAGPFKLRDINVEFDQGKLNLIAGRLGSGKSLLLLALLHEAEVSAGHIQSPRSAPDAIKGDKSEIIPPSEWIRKDLVAYTPQSAFLTNATIKENILFGLPLDKKRYQETIKACQLKPDLDQLEDGDETEIGENGIGLSGGQKTRVSIARSFYSRASTLLLDDVLSAVDASTASRLVSDLFIGRLAQDRTIILVSHQVQLCAPIASKLVLLNDEGRVGFDGSAESFLKSDLYAGLHEEEVDVKEGDEIKPSDLKATSSNAEGESSFSQMAESKSQIKLQEEMTPKKLVKDEKLEEGSVKLSVYLAYVREAGPKLWLATLVFFVAVNSWPALTGAWLREWSFDAIAEHRSHTDLWYFARLAGLYAFEVLLSVISLLLLFNASLRASKRFFKLVLNSVFGATLRFHDTVSRGRLLNRFGSDFEIMDEELASGLHDLIGTILDLMTHLAVVWFTQGTSFVILFAIVLPSYIYVGSAFAAATRDLRRLTMVSKSPIAGAFSDLVSGVTVYRAMGFQDHALSVLTQRTDENAQYVWFETMTSRWMANLFNASSSVVALGSSIYILTKPGISSSTAGFALSFLINIFVRIMFATRSFSDVQKRLVSVERIVEFATELDSEPPSILEPRPPKDWPQGDIVAKDLSLRYSPELPEVLKKVNFTIKKGQKIALVGSTGSGKTSLATALFRFTDPSNGSIEIDGIDITQVGLQDLRSRMQIIPQDPTILSGPLRNSIDVFDEHTDAEVFNALTAVQLIGSSTSPSAAVSIHEDQAQDPQETNANVFRDLSYPIAEGGSNLSNGQRQLICLARALLKKASIIVFDEATSSIDNETEEILSATIREAFADATVLTIAHRLRTIANYDLVMVMDQGSIVEMETPKVLLTRPTSKFYTLCEAGGKAEFEHLKKLAGLDVKDSEGTLI